jgi:hypothetical protein
VGDKAETTYDGTPFSPNLINIALAMISTPWRHIRRERNRRVTPLVKNRGTK